MVTVLDSRTLQIIPAARLSPAASCPETTPTSRQCQEAFRKLNVAYGSELKLSGIQSALIRRN